MNSEISTERLLSLACIEGLKLLRDYLDRKPHLQFVELLETVRQSEPDWRSLDLEAAMLLHEMIDSNIERQEVCFYRVCIREIIMRRRPAWASAIRQGRRPFIGNLSDNGRDVFRAAKLMDDHPSETVVSWWYETAGDIRQAIDLEKSQQGGHAELLTIKYETARLKKLGIENAPKWLGFDDNRVGYDVLSFDKRGNEIINIMIEVKSTRATPLQYIITRNQWNVATKESDRYFFHIWNMREDPPRLFIRTVEDVAPHIAKNSGKGRWETIKVPVGG